MRGKRAKQLRRLAVQYALTEPKLIERHPLIPRRRSEKASHVTLEWQSDSWKRLYRALKKNYCRGGRP